MGRYDSVTSSLRYGSASITDGSGSVDLAYTYSAENDWWSHTVAGGGSVELDDGTIWEERDYLLARLLECKTFKT